MLFDVMVLLLSLWLGFFGLMTKKLNLKTEVGFDLLERMGCVSVV